MLSILIVSVHAAAQDPLDLNGASQVDSKPLVIVHDLGSGRVEISRTDPEPSGRGEFHGNRFTGEVSYGLRVTEQDSQGPCDNFALTC